VNATVDALKADSALQALMGGQKAFTHVEQNTAAPYTMVMGGDEIPWAESMDDLDDTGGRQVDALVQCVSTYRGSSQVDDIASRVMAILLERTPWEAIDGFQTVQFIRNTSQPPQPLGNDGVLWFVRLVTVRVTLA
jgi:hypothetical protein